MMFYNQVKFRKLVIRSMGSIESSLISLDVFITEVTPPPHTPTPPDGVK